jgi:hypothetical protein
VEKLDGIPGWLTLYGNSVAVRKLPHKKAMQETISEGMKIAKDELRPFKTKFGTRARFLHSPRDQVNLVED